MAPSVKELKRQGAEKKVVGLRKKQVWEEHLEIAREKQGQPNRRQLRAWQKSQQRVESKEQQKNNAKCKPQTNRVKKIWSPSIDPALSNKLRLKLARGDKKMLQSEG